MQRLSRNVCRSGRHKSVISAFLRPRWNFTSACDAKGFALDGSIPHNADYRANKAAMDKLVLAHREMINIIYKGGGEKAQKRLKSRNGLPVRERINGLLDSGK